VKPALRPALGSVAAAVMWAGVALAAEAPPDAAAERQRLQAEEQAVRATFAAEEAACRQRFVVTSCIDDARRRERAALASLRQQTLKLDDADRQRRAALRAEQVALKQTAAASAAAEAAAQAASAPAAASAANAAGSATAPATTSAPPASAVEAVGPSPANLLPPLPPPRAPGPDAEALREAAERAAAAERRRQAALAEQARIAEREAQRRASGKASPPLPSPASAARP
jgi:hypothetical protein